MTCGDRHGRGARVDRREVATRVLQREQSVGERNEHRDFAAHLVLPVEQRDLMDQIVVEQHVVDAPILAELLEVDVAQTRAPSGIERTHALPLRRRLGRIVPPIERTLIGGEIVDDVGQLARRMADEGRELAESTRGGRRRNRGGFCALEVEDSVTSKPKTSAAQERRREFIGGVPLVGFERGRLAFAEMIVRVRSGGAQRASVVSRAVVSLSAT